MYFCRLSGNESCRAQLICLSFNVGGACGYSLLQVVYQVAQMCRHCIEIDRKFSEFACPWYFVNPVGEVPFAYPICSISQVYNGLCKVICRNNTCWHNQE